MDEFDEKFVIYERRGDGTFVIEKSGLPYHVTQEFAEWAAVNAQWEAEHHGGV